MLGLIAAKLSANVSTSLLTKAMAMVRIMLRLSPLQVEQLDQSPCRCALGLGRLEFESGWDQALRAHLCILLFRGSMLQA